LQWPLINPCFPFAESPVEDALPIVDELPEASPDLATPAVSLIDDQTDSSLLSDQEGLDDEGIVVDDVPNQPTDDQIPFDSKKEEPQPQDDGSSETIDHYLEASQDFVSGFSTEST